jgi:hypothetical protein
LEVEASEGNKVIAKQKAAIVRMVQVSYNEARVKPVLAAWLKQRVGYIPR